ncbi:MAG: Rrf2 family transcriptional regulator [Spirochaetales bacterium]|jgi:Rrf2 family protein|nr:Rrf2 family transcriptional regulator [Spirochaetales bacterium]
MRISTKGRYSLEALLYLAFLPPNEYASLRQIGESTELSDGYLEQLFIPLRGVDIVRGIRGPRGGYFLGKPPAEISVGDILRAAESSLEPVECLTGAPCPRVDSCQRRLAWKELYLAINNLIDGITLEDLVQSCEAMDREYVI